MRFSVNEKERMVRFSVGEVDEEVTFKFALQLATKLIDVLTGGDPKRMKEIMDGEG
jgi:flagellar motor switch protein FliM